MIAGIILAAGKGTRLKSKGKNKVTLPFLNKPLIIYAVELMLGIADPVVVVVGSFHDSVRNVLKDHKLIFAYQKKRLGTAHATKVGLQALDKISPVPTFVLVGYGDHTMFYTKETVLELVELIKREKTAMSIVTTSYDNPNSLAWGRVIRDKNGYIVDSVEQKDATGEQMEVKELNAGFYCFDYLFLKENINKVPKSTVSGEYYINGLIKIAVEQGKKVVGLKVPFSSVGIGINRYEELEESQKLYLEKDKVSGGRDLNS